MIGFCEVPGLSKEFRPLFRIPDGTKQTGVIPDQQETIFERGKYLWKVVILAILSTLLSLLME